VTVVDTMDASPARTADRALPVIVVSSDTHIGPRLNEELRTYCPARSREDFDAFVRDHEAAQAARRAAMEATGGSVFLAHRNLQTPGHHDMDARLRDMNRDGVAAEVIFHGSQNGEPIPFMPQLLGNTASFDFDRERAAVGLGMYNSWLADVCSIEPERHVGLAHLPMWDIDAAVQAVEHAAHAGLRGVNFPAPRHGVYLEYNDRAWEPFWSACEANEMTLATHVGVASPGKASGPESLALTAVEDGGYFARRAIWWMIFGGVFERHPDLRLVITESPGDWWPYTMRELDSAWLSQAANTAWREQVPKAPSEYCAANVFVGASFLAPFEAERAVREGYASQLLWGSDYPHLEGTWQYDPESDTDSITHLAQRNTFAEITPEQARAMLGMNAIRVYGLDADRLGTVAARIAAPTEEELATPIDQVPGIGSPSAFRTFGPWH
jgi:predicted TIM-barrel fold metal-dependent hydrolase